MNYDYQDLQKLQAESLDFKIQHMEAMVSNFHIREHGHCYISWSGGMDSTFLKYMVQHEFSQSFTWMKDIPAVFCDTGLEYPEIRAFVKSDPNAIILRPKMIFPEVLSTYGYPIISKEVAKAIYEARKAPGGAEDNRMHGLYRNPKNGEKQFDYSKWLPLMKLPIRISHECCHVMKKSPAYEYENSTGNWPITGEMASESRLRMNAWIGTGCNAYSGFSVKRPKSKPMSAFYTQDVLQAVKMLKIPYCSVYGDIVYEDADGNQYDSALFDDCKLKCTGCQRTGCVYCGFGLHLEKVETRFQRLAWKHPRQYEYCICGGQWSDNPKYDATITDKEIWNPKKIWTPSEKGLGMGKVFDMCNEIYGEKFMRYK
jgi:3'-phosphoadenosine 5'-phosphosulfate sulfotransferase (PAPS reductase)/FAD synthetase